MDDEPIDITRANLRKEKKNTVADLVNSPTFHAYVKKVLVPKFAWDFHKNPDDLEQDFWVKALKESQLLKTIDYPKAWAGTIMRNLCINQNRDTQLERELTKPIEREDGRIKEGLKEEAAECDDQPDDLEQPELIMKRKAEICRKVMSILETLGPDERVVVHLLLMTIPVKVIATQIQKSRATVYRLAKEKKAIWKQIVNELGVEAQLDKNRPAKTALIKLVASSLREHSEGQQNLQF